MPNNVNVAALDARLDGPRQALEGDRVKLERVILTENQKKVIKDKYLRDAPSVEDWLWSVAKNIALAELLFDAGVPREEVFRGIRHEVTQSESTPGERSELILLHVGQKNSNDQDANHRHFIQNLNRLADTHARGRKLVEEVGQKYYQMLARFEFLPNSPTLMNAGRELQQLSACYVLPIDDSIDGWGDTVKNTMQIHKSGGGTGFSTCRVRPHGDVVKSTQGVASGAISPLLIINHTTEEIKQGGTRRGANMGILPYWHPDIFDFITAKSVEGRLENFNISVAVDSKFMEAVRDDREVDLLNPRNKQVVRPVRAREVFQLICENAWKTGDPGVIFLDRINNSFSNPTPALGQIEATNPCGEQPLLPYEPCNLGSISLSKFVKDGQVDWAHLERVTKLSIRFLDDVIEVNNYPIPEIEKIAKGNRRIGLGVMGWAEMLAQLGIPYDSPEALAKGEEVMRFINDKSLEASEELAKERGLFPNFRNSIYDEHGPHHRPWAKGRPRNCARTTIAPTGTIAIAAGLQGGGIEPFFAMAYTRYNAKALDALKKGEKPAEKDVFHEVNPVFRRVAEEHHFFGMKEEELWKKIEANHTSVRGLKEIPERIQRVFATAHDVHVEFHVKHQAAFQKSCDNGVSKTINLPTSATVEDIRKTYQMAWEMGCKGITVYRDNCKSQQVLNTGSQGADKKAAAAPKKQPERNLTEGIPGVYYKFETGYGPVHIHIDHIDGTPIRVFTNTTPIGTEIAGLTSVLGILLSKYLELGGDVNEVRKHLNCIKSDKPMGFGPNRIESIPHAISVALTRFLRSMGKLTNGHDTKFLKKEEITAALQNPTPAPTPTEERPLVKVDHCPKCYSPNIAFINGCHGPTCHECGYSECS